VFPRVPVAFSVRATSAALIFGRVNFGRVNRNPIFQATGHPLEPESSHICRGHASAMRQFEKFFRLL
jgi:hypothetical protein